MPVAFTSAETGPARVAVEGAMTIYEAAEQKQELLNALAASDELDIDLSGVDEIDTAGLQLLVLMRREGRRAGKAVRVVDQSAALVEVLERYGLVTQFQESPAGPESLPLARMNDEGAAP
jgi:anti-anti-sigma factor